MRLQKLEDWISTFRWKEVGCIENIPMSDGL